MDVVLLHQLAPALGFDLHPIGDLLAANGGHLCIAVRPAHPHGGHLALEVTVRSRMATSSSALVHHAPGSGAGIGMLSSPLAAADVAQGRLVEVLAPFASRTVPTLYAVSSPGRRNAARVKAVIDFLMKASKDGWDLAPVR